MEYKHVALSVGVNKIVVMEGILLPLEILFEVCPIKI